MSISQIEHTHFARKAFFVYAANGVAASLGVALATICDAVVVGNAFGELGLAITSVVMPLYTLYNFISFSLGTGGSTAVSQFFGREKRGEGQQVFRRCLTLALIISILLAALGSIFLESFVSLLGGASLGESCLRYIGVVVAGAPLFILAPVLSLMIRADGDPGRSTAGIIVSSAVNLVLDLVFVFGLKVGVQGAAWAMVIGQACAIAVYLPHFFQKRYALRLGVSRAALSQGVKLFRDGAGTASSSAWQFGYLSVFNHLLASTSGQQGLAVFNLVFNVGMMAYAVFDGVSMTIPVLAGTYKGERDHVSLNYAVRLAMRSALTAAAVLTTFLLCFAGPVVRIFGIGPDMLAVGSAAVRVYSLSIPFVCAAYVFAATWQTMNQPGLALLTNFLRGFLFLVATGVPLILLLGGSGVAPALLFSEVLGLGVSLLIAHRLQKKKKLDSLYLLSPKYDQIGAVYESVLDKDFQRLPEIMDEIEAFCDENEIPPGTAYSIQLTIEELTANIIRFGFQDNKDHFVAIKVAKYDEDIYVRIRDDAHEYDPFSHAVKDGDEPDMDMLGVEMIRKKAKSFVYQRRLVFNNLLIIL